MEGFDFKQENIVVRVLTSQFVEFSIDKYDAPHFFCWPGAGMTGGRATEDNQTLFLRHLSLFGDHEDGQGVYPRERAGVPTENLVRTLTLFYGNIVLFDLTRQLILRDGPFRYDYAWLSDTYGPPQMEEAAKGLFDRVYGINPDKFAAS